MSSVNNPDVSKTTTHSVVVPFYMYAGISFLASVILLFSSTSDFLQHYFNPHTLAITHLMALGWGTMIILGSSHQLVPVLIDKGLYSEKLAYASFVLAAVGIPILIYGFYIFSLGWIARCGGELIFLAILCYLINIGMSISKSKTTNVHAVFIFTSVVWLMLTVGLGLALVYNFTMPFLSNDSLHYLPLHAHLGIVGWFILMVIGVGSRLVPMFLVSKYSNNPLLWWIFFLINGSLLLYFVLFMIPLTGSYLIVPTSLLMFGILLFVFYCYRVYTGRIRKHIDAQMGISLTSVMMMALPIVLIFLIMALFFINPIGYPTKLVTAYGFLIFFGWITAIILGMTFKTLPFIIWNKVFHSHPSSGKAINPKDLFSAALFRWMVIFYVPGFVFFLLGILLQMPWALNAGAFLLLLTALFYNGNVLKMICYKPKI